MEQHRHHHLRPSCSLSVVFLFRLSRSIRSIRVESSRVESKNSTICHIFRIFAAPLLRYHRPMVTKGDPAEERPSSFSALRATNCRDTSYSMMCDPKRSQDKKVAHDGRPRRTTYCFAFCRTAALGIFLVSGLLSEVTAFSTLSFSRGKIIHPAPQQSSGKHGRRKRNDVMPLSSQWDDAVEVGTASLKPSTSSRAIDRMEKFSRLPVWPVWNGVFIFIISKLFGEDTAAKLEDAIGGRVCPNFFQPDRTSPFIMLVHHRHSFAPWDPLRFIQRTFFPEGFPAHPHRGSYADSFCFVFHCVCNELVVIIYSPQLSSI